MSEEEIAKMIPSTIHMISGCRDEQTSADVSNVASFSLPDPAGRAGGACTSAMLKVLYADHTAPDEDLSFQEVLMNMRDILRSGGYSQIPQLTSSRPLDIKSPFRIIPEGFSGTRRAVVIAINYVGQQGELRGCHNDGLNMIEYIKDIHGFEDENITILMDDGIHTEPTRDNIIEAYQRLVAEAEPGDCCFCHYSGHGGKLRDDNGDEADGYDETLVPVDYSSAGQIRDDDLFKILVGPMREGVSVTSVMDCCHSGTVLDLPYVFVADGESDQMHMAPGFNVAALAGFFQAYMSYKSTGNPDDLISAILNTCGVACAIM